MFPLEVLLGAWEGCMAGGRWGSATVRHVRTTIRRQPSPVQLTLFASAPASLQNSIMQSAVALSARCRSGLVCSRPCRAALRVSPVASLCAVPLPRLRGTCLPHVNKATARKRLAVLTRAAAPEGSATATLTLVNLISALAKASNAWEKYDKDRNGTLSLEVSELTRCGHRLVRCVSLRRADDPYAEAYRACMKL